MFVNTKALLLSMSPKSSPTSKSSPSSVAAPSSEFADTATLFQFVMSAECTDLDAINKHFRSKLEREKAGLMFDICKNEDPQCIFAEARKTHNWNSRQLAILAMAHVDTPFTSAEVAISYLAGAKSSKLLFGPGSGSLGDMKIGVNLDTIYRFVSSKACNSLDDIKAHFDLPTEITAAERMFDISKSEAENCAFKDLREEWDDEDTCYVTKAHAETPFTNSQEASNFVKAAAGSKVVAKDRQFSNFGIGVKPTFIA